VGPLGEWLGGRDSNPDNLLQRQMSYRWTTSQCRRALKRARTSEYNARPTLGPLSYGMLSEPIICSGFDALDALSSAADC
jgi:hypothetical protein